jgi:hypothetical protein
LRNPLVSLFIALGLALGNRADSRAGYSATPPDVRIGYGHDRVQSIDVWAACDKPGEPPALRR